MTTAMYIPALSGPELITTPSVEKTITDIFATADTEEAKLGDHVVFSERDAKSGGRDKNQFATMLLAGNLAYGDWLAGPVLITGPHDDNGNLTDLSPDFVDLAIECWNEYQRWDHNDLY